MRKLFTGCIAALTAALIVSCASPAPEPAANLGDIVPRPISVNTSEGQFIMKRATPVVVTGERGKLLPTAEVFAGQAVPVFGKELRVKAGKARKNAVNLSINSVMQPEEYVMEVKPDRIDISGGSATGVFWALQSLRQLMVPANGVPHDSYYIPAGRIADRPEFRYRGMHLDVARHFFTPDEVKRYIDILAMHKINTLHWHLTDDQGWRVEIKALPLLTEVGSIRSGTLVVEKETRRWLGDDGIPYGGYYTQDEIRDVVAHAASRHITVIPEVDMPGHMEAALTAYPELGCTGGPYEVEKLFGVFDDVLCPGNDKCFDVMQSVLGEMLELFPSEYIHLGGDECPKVRWEKCPKCQARIKAEGLKDEHELQNYFMERMEKWLAEHGRKMIGWDEILEGSGTSKDAVVMSWRGPEGGQTAAKQGNYAIMVPYSYCYFDYYQSQDKANEPYSIGGYVPVEKVYSLDPYDGIAEEHRHYIWGPQANMWSEYILSEAHLQYMLLPRLAALAEVGWTYGGRDYEDFRRRMDNMAAMYDICGYNYATHMFEADADGDPGEGI